MTTRQVFRALPPWAWKVLSAFVGVVGVVWALGVAYGDEWAGIPAQVRAVEGRVDRLERGDSLILRELRAGALRDDRILCLLVLPADVTPLQAARECP